MALIHSSHLYIVQYQVQHTQRDHWTTVTPTRARYDTTGDRSLGHWWQIVAPVGTDYGPLGANYVIYGY